MCQISKVTRRKMRESGFKYFGHTSHHVTEVSDSTGITPKSELVTKSAGAVSRATDARVWKEKILKLCNDLRTNFRLVGR